MLYSLFVLTFGIYLGQEYTIPNIRLISMHLLHTLNIYIENLQNQDHNIDQVKAEQKPFSIFDIFK